MNFANQPNNEKEEVIFGKNAVLAFLNEAANQSTNKGTASKRSTKVNKIFLASGNNMRFDKRLEEIKELAKEQNIPLIAAERRKLDRMVGPEDRHQGVVAQISQADLLQLDEFIADLLGKETTLPKTANHLIAILDGIEDPHNLGAIIRVAECAGVAALLLPARRSAGITGTIARTSAGAIASLPLVRIGNIVKAIEDLKKIGFWIVGLDAAGEQSYLSCDLTGPTVVVIGSEGHGISRLVAEQCDFLLNIPMFGKTNSLNASVASGIIFYEVVRQRLAIKK